MFRLDSASPSETRVPHASVCIGYADVVAPDGTTADAAATAVSVLGPTDGLKFIETERDAAVFIVNVNDEGALQRFFSKGWAALSKAPRDSMVSVAPRRP